LEVPKSTYSSISSLLEPWVTRFLSSRLQKAPSFWHGRLGCYGLEVTNEQSPRIWLHAASVGEVTGAIPIVRTLRERLPGAGLYLTVTTPQGFQFARSNLSSWAQILPFPLDIPAVLERAFRKIQPDLYVALEAEFWPNLFRFLERCQASAILLNGQLSPRSARWYGLFEPLFRPIFEQFVWLAMHSEEDRKNVLLLGASPERTCVLGSSKYDALLLRKDLTKVAEWRRALNLGGDVPVLVGGSLRRSECVQLLEVFCSLKEAAPGLVGIFAPRHMGELANMIKWLDARRVAYQLLSRIKTAQEKRSASVILVDSIGILFDLYALGDLIFCGGTLESFGGHNIMEPAAWGKAVFYGPYLQKVSDEHNILRDSRGGFLVQDSSELLQQWSYWIRHLPELRQHGEDAEEALLKVGGVSTRQVELIMSALAERCVSRPKDGAAGRE
jgi:3-deoxy-D-manno-octulosonic-acid transferase